MTYRDDRDADRARIESLEGELAAANRRVSELEGRREQALVLASPGALAATPGERSASTKWLGAPLELVLEREFQGAFPADRFEELIEPCRAITRDSGRTEILKSSMTWSASTGPKSIGPFLVATVAVRDGVTRLRVTDRLGQAAGAIYGGVGGGAGGGFVFVPIAIGLTVAPVLAPILGAAWLAGTLFGCRALYKRLARRRARQMQQIFDALVADIEAAIAKSKSSTG